MILRSENFLNQTSSRSSKALLFELASFLIDIEHYYSTYAVSIPSLTYCRYTFK